jgi:hypothetical protein
MNMKCAMKVDYKHPYKLYNTYFEVNGYKHGDGAKRQGYIRLFLMYASFEAFMTVTFQVEFF